jgi:hypothetical protein
MEPVGTMLVLLANSIEWGWMLYDHRSCTIGEKDVCPTILPVCAAADHFCTSHKHLIKSSAGNELVSNN